MVSQPICYSKVANSGDRENPLILRKFQPHGTADRTIRTILRRSEDSQYQL